MKMQRGKCMELVAYISPTGTTKKMAAKLASIKKADLFEIEPEVAYTKADLNWMDNNARSTVEMHDKSSRPKMKEKTLDVSKYDKIYIGFPIWWYIAQTIINTFLETFDMSGKEIVLFATSGGSGWGDTLREVQKSTRGKVVLGKVNSIDGI